MDNTTHQNSIKRSWKAFILAFGVAAFLLFMVLTVGPSKADPGECNSLEHYASDLVKKYAADGGGTLHQLRFDDAEDVAAITRELKKLRMAPPGEPAQFLFLIGSNNPAATIIAVFDKNGCFYANGGFPSQTVAFVIKQAFPGRRMPFVKITYTRNA